MTPIRFRSPALFEHRSGPPYHAPNDRIVTLGERLEIVQEVSPNIRAQIIVSRPENLPRR